MGIYVGGGHCPGSCLRWLSWSEWLPQFSLARTLWCFFGLWCLPSWCSSWCFECELQCHSWVSLFHCLSMFTQTDFQCPLIVSPTYHVGNPYRGFHTPLLSVSALGSCSSPALVLFSKFSWVLRQASPPEGHRPFQSSRWAPWCRGCTRAWLHHPVIAVVPGFLGGRLVGVRVSFTRFSGNPFSWNNADLGGPFPVVSSWDDRWCMLCPSCNSGPRHGPQVVVWVIRDVFFGVGGLPIHWGQ